MPLRKVSLHISTTASCECSLNAVLTERSDGDVGVTRSPYFGTEIVRVIGGALQPVQRTSAKGVRRSGKSQSGIQLFPAVDRRAWMTVSARARERRCGRDARFVRSDHHAIGAFFIAHITEHALNVEPNSQNI